MADLQAITGIERTFGADEIIVSKTDPKGKLMYTNRLFQRIAGYTEPELLGKPHNIIRHPDMPRCIFKFLWDTIESGNEIFAYVINRCKNGDYYWVFAHVTPTFGINGEIVGYHSNRRVPKPEALEVIKPIYAALLAEEQKHRNPKEQWKASLPLLQAKLDEIEMTYDEFIFEICV